MAELSLYTLTFNCGLKAIDTTFFASNLFNALTTTLPPDLIVLSLQEIADLCYAFIGGSMLQPLFARFGDAVRIAAEKQFGAEVEYETLMARNVGLTGIMVFARREVAQKVRWMKTAGVGVGVAQMGNKGAVGVRVALEGVGEGDEEVLVTFVAAHLAPFEEVYEKRNQDWQSICEGIVFEDEGSGSGTLQRREDGEESAPLLSKPSESEGKGQQHTLFSPPTHLFFLGDLNYRTSDTSPSASDHENWPQPTTSLEDQHHYAHLLRSDQLTRERKANKTLHNLSEAPINFPPTYKYSPAAQKHAAESAKRQQMDDDETWLWAKHRIPSWCDRILYLTAAQPKVHAYDALPIQPTSDHRPVALSCSVSFAPVKADGDVRSPFSLRRDWRERRRNARHKELVVGVATYLAWTWEGEALMLGTAVGLVGGWFMLKALLGGV